MDQGGIATAEEVLELFTSIIRGDTGEDVPKISEKLKAAEMLCKYLKPAGEEESAGEKADIERDAKEAAEELSRFMEAYCENGGGKAAAD